MTANSAIEPLRYEFAQFTSAEETVAPGERQRLISEDEIEAIRQAAMQEGAAKAQAEAEAGFASRQAAAMEAAGTAMHSLAGAFDATRRDAEQGSAALSLAIGKAIAGYAIAHAPLEVIAPMVTEALDALFEETKVVVEVHEAIVDVVREKIEAIAEETGFDGRVRVRAGADNIADCRIEWGEGGIERRAADITREISDRIAAHGIALPPARVKRES